MKKIYFLAIAVCAFAFSTTTNAQIIDDSFDFYTPGPMGDQAPGVWRNWSGTPGGTTEDIEVVTDNSLSGTQSGFIGGSGAQDAVLELGNQTSGDYTLIFQMFIPAGATGYFNFQGEIPAGPVAGVFNSSDIYFNETGGTPGTGDDGDGNPFSYPEDTWFQVAFYFDLAGPTYDFVVDGVVVSDDRAFGADSTVGGIDFFSANANTEYWVDDVFFDAGNLLGGNDLGVAEFTVYPNPVKDVLNIQTVSTVDAVTVYDVLGKVVLQAQPDAVSPSINMSALSSGAYLVQVTIGNAVKTVKVIK
jgi:hypothetical protein